MKMLPSRGKIILLIVLATYAVLQVYGRFMVLRSEPYLYSVQFLMNNGRVTDHLGKPEKITLAIFDSYDLHNSPGSEGSAKFALIVQGPKGRARAYLELTRKTRAWQMTKADLVSENGGQVDLLTPGDTGGLQPQ